MSRFDLNRREFLRSTGLAASALGLAEKGFSSKLPGKVAIYADPSDAIVKSPPVIWALEYLSTALRGASVEVIPVAKPEAETDLLIIASSFAGPSAADLLSAHKIVVTHAPEALAIVLEKRQGKTARLLASSYDVRGLVYAITEIADVVKNSENPLADLMAIQSRAEQPANRVRSLTRLFCSEVEDKPWYNDREMWPAYFDLLASQRFNRFNLAFGIGYDFIQKVTDAYFLFTYPFLLKVPGYEVRVPQLPDAERDNNLEMLKFIGKECVKRGIEFHVGLWMHGYAWINSPDANYTIEGLNKSNHGAYCRDAVRLLLQDVPDIQGLTFRIHGESGVEEGSFEFWKTVFDGVAQCGRRVPIDMHAKGMSPQMIDIALATRQCVQISPKFWGEHMGMPYQQTDIRLEEKPKAMDEKGLMALSSGTRSFLRYSYGDLLTEDRKYTVVCRVWPGTQRLLLWGDPLFAAAYSRAFSFCGMDGVEIQEMLSFKGRRGSGHAGDRCAYLDNSYKVRWDWQKYEYGTRIWGRMLYNPDTDPRVPERLLVKQIGRASEALADALASASRILPVVTSVYAPSAGNNTYWPELYLNESMVDAANFGPYGDSPKPRIFGTASPFDPQMFSTMNDYAEELLAGEPSSKYSHAEVATWLEAYASGARNALARADAIAIGRGSTAYRRARVDILIEAGLGEFFAAKFRSGILFHLYEKTKSQAALDASIRQYRLAREHWAKLAEIADGVYVSDITLGELPVLRGHWSDRLPAIDKDIASISAMRNASTYETPAVVAAAISTVLKLGVRPAVIGQHRVAERFVKGEDLKVEFECSQPIERVLLHYRHVDQAEMFVSVPMEKKGKTYVAVIPATYTKSEFPLQYFFEAMTKEQKGLMYPGFIENRTNQPYFVVRSA